MDLPRRAMLPPVVAVARVVRVPADCMVLMATGGIHTHPLGVMAVSV